MAKLVKCKDCGHEVSKKAKTCPNCGVKKPAAKGMSKSKAVLLVVVAIAAVGVFMDDDTNTSSSRRQAVQSPEGTATQAEEAVGERCPAQRTRVLNIVFPPCLLRHQILRFECRKSNFALGGRSFA